MGFFSFLIFVLLPILVLVLVLISRKGARSGSLRTSATRTGRVAASNQTVTNYRWVPPGETVKIADYTIPGGMIYVGESLPSVARGNLEPALVVPSLRVARSRPSRDGTGMTYWPSYAGIPSECRAAYLEWLASGRRDPNAYIGYVFLYFYGLERRVLYDATKEVAARTELAAIHEEVTQLLVLYNRNNSFRNYASSLLGVLSILDGRLLQREPPAYASKSYELPLELRVTLANFSRASQPIPAAWAYAWATLHAEISLRTPATRCRDEFKSLFHHRYAQRFGSGMVIPPNKKALSVEYRPASSSFGGPIGIPIGDLPDVTALKKPVEQLRDLVEECTTALEAHSRLRGKSGDKESSLRALATLPPEIVSASTEPALLSLRQWLQEHASGRHPSIVPAAALLDIWQLRPVEKAGKADAVAIAQLLGKLNYGVEPDVRFGGPAFDAKAKVALFPIAPTAPEAPSAEYTAAAILLNLGVVVSASDGVDERESAMLSKHVEDALRLDEAEKARLRAHLQYLLAEPPKLTRLKKRLDDLSPSQKETIADFLIGVAATDGRITKAEISTLTKLYALLGLNPDDVYGHVHAFTAGSDGVIGRPPAEPVTIRMASEKKSGYAVPPRPSPPKQEEYVLDMRRVDAKIAESAAVSALLADIFTEQESVGRTVAACTSTAASALPTILSGVDSRHNALIVEVLTRGSWSRSEWEDLCTSHELLADGAMETINEAAFDAHGAPLLEGDDPVEVSPEVAKELAR